MGVSVPTTWTRQFQGLFASSLDVKLVYVLGQRPWGKPEIQSQLKHSMKIQDLQLNLSYRYTTNNFLVQVVPKYCMELTYIEKVIIAYLKLNLTGNPAFLFAIYWNVWW